MNSNCLGCGRPLDGTTSFHTACLRRLFDVTWIPTIPFGLHDFQRYVSQAIAQHPMSISGVQKKASVRLDTTTRQLEIVSIGGTHILKPEADLYLQIPLVENVCMTMAEHADIDVPPHGLLPMKDGSLCYIVRRFDRLADGTKTGQEDMKQILGAEDKYKGSIESIGKSLLKYTANPGLELIKLFDRVLFSFLIGNGDMHLKNWSLTEPKDGRNSLTPAYDLLSSTLYIPGESESALTIRGKNSRLRRRDFEELADHLKIDPKAAQNSLRRLLGLLDLYLQMIRDTDLTLKNKESLSSILTERFARLSKTAAP